MFSFPWCSFQSWSLDGVSFVALTINGSGIWLFSLQTSEVLWLFPQFAASSWSLKDSFIFWTVQGTSGHTWSAICLIYPCFDSSLNSILCFPLNVSEWFRVNPSRSRECLRLSLLHSFCYSLAGMVICYFMVSFGSKLHEISHKKDTQLVISDILSVTWEGHGKGI